MQSDQPSREYQNDNKATKKIKTPRFNVENLKVRKNHGTNSEQYFHYNKYNGDTTLPYQPRLGVYKNQQYIIKNMLSLAYTRVLIIIT